MDETRRLLRYILPGLLYGLQTLLFLWLLFPSWTVDKLLSVASDQALAAAIGGVLASGAAGYLISMAHHELHWRKRTGRIDHRAAVKLLRDLGLLQLSQVENHTVTKCGESLTREEAFLTVAVLWHQRADNGPISGATPKAQSLSDVAHSLGSATVAAALAVVTTIIIAKQISERSFACESVIRFSLFVVLAFLLICGAYLNYLRTARLYQRFVDAVLLDALDNECRISGLLVKPVKLTLTEYPLRSSPTAQRILDGGNKSSQKKGAG